MRLTVLCLTLFWTLFLYAENIQVKFILGEVRYKESARVESWLPLSMSTPLAEKNIIRTGSKSLCEIQLADGTYTKLLENSMLELRNTNQPQERGLEIFAALGTFYFKVKSALSHSFTVSSPVAVMAVRGTEFILIHQDDRSEVLVKSGEVDFSDPDKRNLVRIRSGQKSSLVMGQIPSDPVPMGENELKAFDKLQEPSDSPSPERAVVPDNSLQIGETGQPQATDPRLQVPTSDQPADAGLRDRPAFGAGIAIGAVTIDNQIYNHIGFRPEFSLGKLGVALDLSFYIDKDGNVRKDNWDSYRDIFEKIYYVRWGVPGDPLYIKVGAIDNYRLGFGLLMNHYSNTIEYPHVIRTGMELGIQTPKFGIQGMLNNFSEFTDGGGLSAGRITYPVWGNLQVGASMVFDRNQYKSLKDRDGDGVPDYLDAFPDDKRYAVDSDGDGIPDEIDYDRDGNGFTDNRDYLIETGLDTNLLNDQAYLADPEQWKLDHLAPEPFNVNRAKNKSQIAFALDISYPLLTYEYLKLITYAQWAKYPFSGGWGITAPGFLAKFAFIDLYAEYRIFGARFLPEYFNTTYELERAVFVIPAVGDSSRFIEPRTKRETLSEIREDLKGYMVGADFNLFDFLIFGAEYQNMTRSALKIRTLRGSLDLNPRIIPKINKAGAYYYQNNAREIFKKSEGTVLGYRLGYEISPGATLLFDFRQIYRDLNGDGKISGRDETTRITSIQTVIRF